MIIKFSREEQEKIIFREVKRRALSNQYLEQREEVWQRKLSESKQKNQKLWNGEVYTIETLIQYDESRVVLELGSSEYKDIIFRSQLGAERISEEFGSNHLLNFITVDCIPVTTDRKAVFGVRAKGTYVQEGALGLIGGTLNKDEMSVKSLNDITQFMLKEIREETAMVLPFESLRLFSVNFFRSKYEFLYTVNLDCSSNEIQKLHRDGEFSRLVALNRDELEKTDLTPLDTIRFCKNYLSDLL